MKEWMKRLSWVPAVIMMVIIFLFYAKTADQSNQQSSFVAEIALDAVETVAGVEYRQELEADAVRMDGLVFLIRKLAHATEYAVLAVCVGLHVLASRKERGLLYFLAVVGVCALYACSDEVHQLFVSGRSGQISDVCVDTAGAAVGALFLYAAAGRRLSRIFGTQE